MIGNYISPDLLQINLYSCKQNEGAVVHKTCFKNYSNCLAKQFTDDCSVLLKIDRDFGAMNLV